MSYSALISAVVGEGTADAQGKGLFINNHANDQADALKAAAGRITKKSVGSVPKPALYTPVDFNAEQWNAIMRDRDSLGAITSLTNKTNDNIANEDIHQANRLIPGYSSSMTRLGASANDLIQGRLPDDVLQSIVADRAGKSSGVNIPGLAGPATLKDLGLSSLDALNTGTGLLGKMTQMAESISPSSERVNPQTFFQTPQQNIENETRQNELLQQSQQNANNLAAAPDPVAAARLHLQLGQALTPNTSGAAVGQGIAQGGQGIAAILGRMGGQQGGGGAASFSSGDGMNNAGFYTSPGALNSAFSTPGYTPVYGTSPQGYYFQGYNPVTA